MIRECGFSVYYIPQIKNVSIFFLNKGLNLIEITLKQYESVPECFMNVKASKIWKKKKSL